MKKILVFASGSTGGGGSGFRKLVEGSLSGVLKAEIISVVLNYPSGGVRRSPTNSELILHALMVRSMRKDIGRLSSDMMLI